jgi:choline dehydrogenase-like flavoprotein
MDKGLETIMAGEVVLSAGTVPSSTILVHSGIGPAKQLRKHGIAVIVDASLKSGSIAESCRGAHTSGGMSHRRALIIVDNVPPEPIRAAPHDVARCTVHVHDLAVRTCSVN